MPKLNALIAGSTGYIGIQLIKLLVKHKNVDIRYFVEIRQLVKWYIIMTNHLKNKNFLKSSNLKKIFKESRYNIYCSSKR